MKTNLRERKEEDLESIVQSYIRMNKSGLFQGKGKYSVEDKVCIIKDLIYKTSDHIIPDRYPDFMVQDNDWLSCNGMHEMIFRDIFIKNIGFSLISNAWIKPLTEWIGNKKCLEVMSGCGSLSYVLKQQGVDITPTDNFSWKGMSNWNNNKNYWIDIENIDAVEAVKKYGNSIDVIIMSWAYMDDMAYKVLLEMRKQNLNCKMIFIGEGEGGCTANDSFFENIKEIEDNTFNEVQNNYQQWSGIHDYPILVE